MPTEATWTPPRTSCPHPEYWHAADSDSTEDEVGDLIAGLVTGLQPELVVETGSAFGYTTEKIGRALQANGHGLCCSLEIDEERAEIAAERCAGLPVAVSAESSLDFEPPARIDLLFSDSDYTLRRREVERFVEWMDVGAFVVIHDTTSGERGHHVDMRHEVERLEWGGVLKAIYLPTPRGLAICQLL